MRNRWKACLSIAGIVLLYKLKTLFQANGLILADPVTAGLAIGGGLGLGKDLFGTASSQQGSQRTFTQFRPEDLLAIQQARTGYTTGMQDLLNQLQASRQALQQGFRMPTAEFQFAQSPDAMTRAIAAQAAQGMGQQAATQRQQIAQQFRGQPGAARALMAQADIQTRLQQNPLLFQAFQQQQGRELAQAQMQQAAVEAANRALLGREQAQVGLTGTGLSAQQNLLAQQLGLGQALGEQIQTQAQRGRAGGLLK